MAKLDPTRFILILILSIALMPTGSVHASPEGVLVVKMEGTISTVSREFLGEALDFAEANELLVILMLDTPGGSVDSTFEIIDLIESSAVPVVGFVHPRGARAWSAGTYILLSTHIAAMAPFTVIGSGQPVTISFAGSEPVTDSKTVNALTAFIVERARMHGRNVTAAELFVRENLNMNDEEALRYGVVEFTAASVPELLEEIDGLSVVTSLGEITVETRRGEVADWSPSPRVLFLKAFSEPIVALLMLTLGFYAVLFGLYTPGLGAEVVGSVVLVLGLIGVGLIRNVNLGGLILICLGAILLIAENYIPDFGVVGVAGIVSTVFGSVLLFAKQWMVSRAWLNTLILASVTVPLILGGFIIYAAYKVLQVRRRPHVIGGFVGGEGVVAEEITTERDGFIVYRGEYWKARSAEALEPGRPVIITGKEGPILIVKAVKETG